MSDYVVKDIALADFGRKELDIAETEMPGLMALRSEYGEEQIENAVSQCMDLTPRGIRMHLGLNKPIYQRTAAYGHFGRAPDADGGFSWERTDLIDAILNRLAS